jgi:hypothetical protein
MTSDHIHVIVGASLAGAKAAEPLRRSPLLLADQKIESSPA